MLNKPLPLLLLILSLLFCIASCNKGQSAGDAEEEASVPKIDENLHIYYFASATDSSTRDSSVHKNDKQVLKEIQRV